MLSHFICGTTLQGECYYYLPRFAVKGDTHSSSAVQITQQPLSSLHAHLFCLHLNWPNFYGFQWKSPEFWVLFPLGPFHSHSATSLFLPSCYAHFIDCNKGLLPVKWSLDTEHSSWAQAFDGTAYFSLCQPFSCGEWQKKGRDTHAVMISFPKYLLSADDVLGTTHIVSQKRMISPAHGADISPSWERKTVNNK